MNSTEPQKTAITTNAHDGGYDIVAGRDITGPVIGSIYIGADEPGVWMDLNGEGWAIDDADHAVSVIREETGRALSPEYLADVAALFA